MSASHDTKGKSQDPGAARQPAPPPDVRRRAVPGAEVIQNWQDPGVGDNDQRGYNQAKFEDAYRYVVFELGPEITAQRQREREKKALNAAKLASTENQQALTTILKELSVTRHEAEEALLANDCRLDDALLQLIEPPPGFPDPPVQKTSAA